MIRIQPFEPRYRDGVAQLIVPIQRDEFDIAITYEQQTDLHDIAASYQTGSGQFWIALTDDDTVVGSIALRDLGHGDASLHKMFVAADYRGAPHRVAHRLLETLIGHAEATHMQTLYLGTTDKFHGAHRFYEKNGFEKIDPEFLPPSYARMAVDSVFYRLALK